MIQALRKILKDVREVSPHMTASQLDVYLYVATHEGCGVSDVERDLDLSKSTTSRTLRVLGPSLAGREENLGFIKLEEYPLDLRVKICSLTAEGTAFLEKIERHLVPNTPKKQQLETSNRQEDF